MNIQVGDSYILPRDLHIESRNIRTVQGKKHRKGKVLQSGTEVSITNLNKGSGDVGFTDGEYRYYTTWAKMSGSLRYFHLGYDFFFQNGVCTVRDLIALSHVETFILPSSIDKKAFRQECEQRTHNYKRITTT